MEKLDHLMELLSLIESYPSSALLFDSQVCCSADTQEGEHVAIELGHFKEVDHFEDEDAS